jgi:phospholipid transport system substrate-binding protein
MTQPFTRRRLLATLPAAALVAALPAPVLALTTDSAEALIDRLVGDINRVINSGKSESAMFGDFERIFAKYADVPIIARQTLGPDARRASAGQMTAYTRAFQSYISRKYGKRFREFIGGQIEVKSARAVKSFYEVKTVAILKGEAPFDVTFLVSDKSGRDLFFDMFIEGISLLKAERTEIGAMLDRRKGDIDAMIADLKRAG